MEFGTIKKSNHIINVVFVGSHYYFYDEGNGVACIAVRNYDKTDFRGKGEGHTAFTLYLGNQFLIGGSINDNVMFSIAKKYINKNENRYIPTKVEYEVEIAPLHKFSLKCEAEELTDGGWKKFEGK